MEFVLYPMNEMDEPEHMIGWTTTFWNSVMVVSIVKGLDAKRVPVRDQSSVDEVLEVGSESVPRIVVVVVWANIVVVKKEKKKK